jgi:hypothetical protein
MRAGATLAAAIWFATSVASAGCATTRYMGPLDIVPDPPRVAPAATGHSAAPVKDDYPACLPKIIAVTPTQVVFGYPGSTPQLLPRNSTYVQEQTNYGVGALEGFLGGAAIGAVAGAIGAKGCSSGSCAGAAIALTALVSGALGALYGVVVGQKTTYVFAPSPPP